MRVQIDSFDNGILQLIAEKENDEEVKSIINQENLYKVVDSSTNTLLHLVVKWGNAAIAKFLINSGSNVDAQNDVGQTPLMLSITHGREDMSIVLLEADANVDLKDTNGETVFSMITERIWLSIKFLKLFLRKLESNCLNTKEEIAKKIINAKWPLLMVVRLKNADVTKKVLELAYSKNIDINEILYTESALHEAVKSVDLENVQILLEYTENVNVTDCHRRTPMSYVYDSYNSVNQQFQKKNHIMKMLVDRGAILISGDPKNVQDPYNIFEYASREIIKILLDTDINLFAGNSDGETIVHALVVNKNPGVIQELRGKRFDIDARNWYNVTPLMKAAHYGNVEAVKFLLNEGADVNAVNNGNSSAIFCSIFNSSSKLEEQYTGCVQVLLESGANVQEVQVRHITILDVIRDKNFSLLDKIVLSHLALLDARGSPITEDIRITIKSFDYFETYFEASKQILTTIVYRSMTVLDLLNATNGTFERYVSNEELVSKIELSIKTLLSEYRYFGHALQNRMSKATRMVSLKMEAVSVTSEIMGRGDERFYPVFVFVVDYLEQRDLENLISLIL